MERNGNRGDRWTFGWLPLKMSDRYIKAVAFYCASNYNESMPRIRSEKAQAGMKVIRDITDSEGMLLIPSGCILSERHVDLLSSWEVSEIEVEENPSEDASEKSPVENLTSEELEQLKAQVLARFYHFDDQSPVLQEAYRLALLRQATRYQRGVSS